MVESPTLPIDTLPNGRHYLGAIRRKLERLYDVYPNDPILREQISDEVDWIDSVLCDE